MSNQTDFKALSIARRKEILLAQGAIYRVGLSGAKDMVQAKLQAESVFQSLIRAGASAGFSALKSRASRPGFAAQAVLPVLISGVAALSRKVRAKPLARGLLLVGAVGAVVGFLVKRKKAREAAWQDNGN